MKNIEYIVCEEWQEDSTQDKVFFKLKPEIVSVNIPLKIMGHNMGKLTSLKIMQFVNSNIATTGHKLQGQTKKVLVVGSWYYSCPNWVYVVLSRVTTLSGLYIKEKLIEDMEKYRIRDDLLVEDQRLRDLDSALHIELKWFKLKKLFGFL